VRERSQAGIHYEWQHDPSTRPRQLRNRPALRDGKEAPPTRSIHPLGFERDFELTQRRQDAKVFFWEAIDHPLNAILHEVSRERRERLSSLRDAGNFVIWPWIRAINSTATVFAPLTRCSSFTGRERMDGLGGHATRNRVAMGGR
jgi:hypothetical protein